MMEDAWGSELRAHDFCVFGFPIHSCSFVEENLMLYSGTDTHTHTQPKKLKMFSYWEMGRGGGGTRSIREIPLSSYEAPIINLLVSIQPTRSSVMYYIHHNASALHTPQCFCRLWCNITYRGIYRVAYLFAGAPELPLKTFRRTLCVCVRVRVRTHTHFCVTSTASYSGSNAEHRNMACNSAAEACS
jgi:hypothetical protein